MPSLVRRRAIRIRDTVRVCPSRQAAVRVGEAKAPGQSWRRLAWPLATITALGLLWLVTWASGLRLIYNASDSEARGWYLARPATRPLTHGALVVFPVPQQVAGL